MTHKSSNNKKGNLTVILIGLICMMIVLTLALSKRMTSHTQLLTLGDYTQISRYFLESYVGAVMQQMRKQINEPSSELAKAICESIGELSEDKDITDKLDFSISGTMLDSLANDGYGRGKIKNLKHTIVMTKDETMALTYPDKINAGDKAGMEKTGILQITCKCEFMKREYTLVVQYPFTVVYRMTPILKDFMLFVDNFYSEQREYEYGDERRSGNKNLDTINILPITKGQLSDDKKLPKVFDATNVNTNRELDIYRRIDSDFDGFRPWGLMDNSKENSNDTALELSKKSGMVYFGPTDFQLKKSIYLNLAGTTITGLNERNVYNCSDIFNISQDYFDLGLDDNIKMEKAIFGLGNDFYAFGVDFPMKSPNHSLKFGYLGFSSEISDIFEGSVYSLDEFLGTESTASDINEWNNTYWGQICNRSDKNDIMSFATGIKPYGVSFNEDYMGVHIGQYQTATATPRQIYGNVFGRFIVLSFWDFGSGQNPTLQFDTGLTIDQYNENKREYHRELSYLGTENNTQNYDLDPVNNTNDSRFYQKLMSKVVSGMNAYGNYEKEGDNDSGGSRQYLFMPLNIEYTPDDKSKGKLFDERDFEPNDGFKLVSEDDPSQVFLFHDFGEKWFKPREDNGNSPDSDSDDSENEYLSSIEARIGRAFTNQDDFKKAVGYPDKFLINGVVYVGGDLELDDDMDLPKGKCSGGIVLVDGNIKLGNITRGESINNLTLENFNDYFKKWVDPSNDSYVATDSIITFVCLKPEESRNESRCITINGNNILGVQLINLGDNNATQDQIKWNTKAPNFNENQEILFYGSIACNKLFLPNRLKEFGHIRRNVSEKDINMPFFIYPEVMADAEPPLAVQIMENMRGYRLSSSKTSE